jgi:hypothetical protein
MNKVMVFLTGLIIVVIGVMLITAPEATLPSVSVGVFVCLAGFAIFLAPIAGETLVSTIEWCVSHPLSLVVIGIILIFIATQLGAFSIAELISDVSW